LPHDHRGCAGPRQFGAGLNCARRPVAGEKPGVVRRHQNTALAAIGFVRRLNSSPLVTIRRVAPSGLSRRQVRDRQQSVVCGTMDGKCVCPSGDAAFREQLHDPFDLRRGRGAAVLVCLRRGADRASHGRSGAGSRDRRAGAGEPHPQRPRRARRLWPRQHPPSVRSGPLSDGARDRARPGDRRRHHGVRSRVQSGRPSRPFVVRRALHPRRGLQVAAGGQ
jgi:hypothetical protein